MPERVLLVQLADIGNLVLATPAIAAIRAALPDAHLALLTSTHAAAILEPGLVDEVIAFDRKDMDGTRALFKPANLRRIFALRNGNYDAVVFFHHFTLLGGTVKFGLIAFASGAERRIGLQNGKGWFLNESIPDSGFGARHQAQYWLDLAGILGADSSPRGARVHIAKNAPLEVDNTCKTVVIHAGSGGYSRARRWGPERFAAVADQLVNERDVRVVLVGGHGDDTEAVKAALAVDAVDVSHQTTLPELARVIADADLFIGADSGVTHIAAATGTPVIAVFGPSNHEAWGPWTPESQSIIVRSAPLCSPCMYVGHEIGLREGCEALTCMRLVTVERVIDVAKALLDGREYIQTEISTARKHKHLRMLGLPVDAITYDDLLATIGEWIDSPGRARQICTTNPEFMIMAQDDSHFRGILRQADLCVADGVGLLWAAKRQGNPLPGRVTGSDGVPIIAQEAAKRGWKLFLLGAGPGIAEQTAEILVERYPGLQIVGTHGGSPAASEEDAIVRRVNASGADILFVAYGAPNQDKWIARNVPRLHVSVAMGVGGTFDFIAGVVPRAPEWMRHMGIEWLFRLIRQPWRIRRMLRLPVFVWRVIRQR